VTDLSAHTVEAADEGRHEPGPDVWWNESWYLDFVDDGGDLAGYVRLGLYPNQGVAWWTVAIVGPDRPLVEAVDLTLPVPSTWDAPGGHGPGGRVEIDAHGTSVACVFEDPLQAMRVVARGPAATYAHPADVYRSAPAVTGQQLDLDLTWRSDGEAYHYVHTTRYELPCRVAGTLTVDGTTYEITGQGQRDHSWAPRDWWTIDWCWFSGRLDDGTRVHGADIRIGPDLRPSFGYVQDGDGVHPVEHDLVVEETLGPEQLPTAATIRCAPVGLDLAVEPVAFGPLLFVDPDGRVDRFPRAWCRYTAADGRTGEGWIEWNQVQRT
jgi:hypothetical protein